MKIFLTILLIVSFFAISGCTTRTEIVAKPMRPRVCYRCQAVWVPGHYNVTGRWIPGHWRVRP